MPSEFDNCFLNLLRRDDLTVMKLVTEEERLKLHDINSNEKITEFRIQLNATIPSVSPTSKNKPISKEFKVKKCWYSGYLCHIQGV